jgi:transcriptional regulator with XRE-family HTH domain
VESEVAKRVIERVRQWRESHDLTQEDFAERADLKYKHYQAIEAGRKIDFKISTFEKLAKACGLEPWELLMPQSFAAYVAEAPAKAGKPVRRRATH